MAYLGNTPTQSTILRVEARKSFSLGVHIRDPKGKPADLTNCVLTIVAKATPINEDDATNILAGEATAVITQPASGYARFDIQAASLDQDPGEYPYAIVLQTAEGYTSVLVKGILDIQQNTEFASVSSTYSNVNPPQSLNVLLQAKNVIDVYVGGQLPPGMNYVRDDVVETIEGFDPDSVAMVPEGGANGYVLTKTSAGDYAMGWRPVGNGEFALDATGQPPGYVPAAQGDDTWIWAAVGIDATGQPSGYVPVSDGADGWAWAEAQTTVDWDETEGQPGSILNKPALGTAAAADSEDFVAATTLVSDMAGVHFVTAIPVSGTDGHLYLVYEE